MVLGAACGSATVLRQHGCDARPNGVPEVPTYPDRPHCGPRQRVFTLTGLMPIFALTAYARNERADISQEGGMMVPRTGFEPV